MENLKKVYDFLVATATFDAPRGYHGVMASRPAAEIAAGGTSSPCALQGEQILLCDLNAEERGFTPLCEGLRSARDRAEQRDAIEAFLRSDFGRKLRRRIEDRLRKDSASLLTAAAALREV
jgi:hypothetical protein